MKKLFTLLLTAMMLLTCTFGTHAANIGDIVNSTLYTDIVAKINGQDIASYNIEGYTVIVAEDLVNYGFFVEWNEYERALYITRNTAMTSVASNYSAPYISPNKIGKKASNVLYTDIRTYMDGQPVTSYNIGGKTVIYFDDLARYGKITYSNTFRTLFGQFSWMNGAVTVSGKDYYPGMSASELATPDEILPSMEGHSWYVFGTTTYRDFIALGILDEMVVAVASAGPGFRYCGYQAGDTTATQISNFAYDKNDSSKIHGVYTSIGNNKKSSVSTDTLYGESKLNFHCTNAFRVLHGLNPLSWSNAAATSARLHSEDMANNNYFSHDNLNGKDPFERMHDQNINWRSAAENICAGYGSGFQSYNGWVNSFSHRKNMLGNFLYLGVGGGYNDASSYGDYYTQNFYR